MLASLEAVTKAAGAAARGKAGDLRLGVRSPPLGEPLRGMLARWRQAHPDVRLIVHELPDLELFTGSWLAASTWRSFRALRRGRRLWTALQQNEHLPPVEIPSNGWEIYIQPDRDGELARGSLGIVSKLTMPMPPAYVGTPTTRIVKTVFADGRRTTAMSEVQAVAADVQSSAGPTVATSDRGQATLMYEDEEGPHLFIVKKDCIKVGRGGMGAWVDVQVMTNPKVSREHCWIHCDRGGRFFIQDVSTWGTSVNGELIPPAVRSEEGSVIQAGARKELPAGARIALADALVIQFQVASLP
jgi:hypothetical protein